MSRVLPAHVAQQIKPVPDSFRPAFTDPDDRYLRWSTKLTVGGRSVVVELGYHKRKGESDQIAAEHLRANAWQVLELARLGRHDLLNHARKLRHKNRTIGKKA